MNGLGSGGWSGWRWCNYQSSTPISHKKFIIARINNFFCPLSRFASKKDSYIEVGVVSIYSP